MSAIQSSIRQILYLEWDPIGVAGLAPEDEYDLYVPAIQVILAGSRSEEELVDYLTWVEASRMLLSPSTPVEQLRTIAKKLLKLDLC